MEPREILLYSRSDCPLCDEGAETLARVAGRFGLLVRKVDIAVDPVLLERHRYRIPVAECCGEELGWGRLSERGMTRRLERLLAK